jgi:hypothetical protein
MALRDILCNYDRCSKGIRLLLPPPDCYQSEPYIHNLWSISWIGDLYGFLLLLPHSPMQACHIFLDAVHRSTWLMSFCNFHHLFQLHSLSYVYRHRLDALYPSMVLCLGPKDEHQNQGHSGHDSWARNRVCLLRISSLPSYTSNFNIVQARQPASGLGTSRVLLRQQTLSFSLATSLCGRSSRRVSGFWHVLSRP